MDVMLGVLIMWYILTLGSVVFLLWDQFTNTPSMRVMTWAWVLLILYTGPIGLFVYFMSCRQPLSGTHDQFISAHWKQAVGSLIHCVAGDATAIILIAVILNYFPVSNGVEVIIEYIVAYLFGLLIFQALFMLSMYKNYGQAIVKTIFPETVSMNMVMTGMFPVMIVLAFLYPISKDPGTIYFWGRMSAATLAGFLVAYPINSWMVKRKIKHGMMSMPSAGNGGHDHMSMGHDHSSMKHNHQQGGLSFGLTLWSYLWTYAVLVIVLYIVSLFAPITFH